jgi:hypothetical protein
VWITRRCERGLRRSPHLPSPQCWESRRNLLHHAGPLAGAALLAGAAGSLLFAAVGLIGSIPLLLGVHRRCRNWRMPAALLGLFAVVFSLSAFVIGAAITNGDGNSTPKTTPATAPARGTHEAHHG